MAPSGGALPDAAVKAKDRIRQAFEHDRRVPRRGTLRSRCCEIVLRQCFTQADLEASVFDVPS